ncbi:MULTISPECIES: hypothetical protein [Nitrosomonas]|nr:MULTISPECIES: hypothetical protein [Nitrosomonas]UVS60544.1 hypothetical protein NX761_13675 [Nitrosomonas sp. PLL12]
MRSLLPQDFRGFRLFSDLRANIQAQFFVVFRTSVVAGAARGHSTELPG